VNGSRDDEAAWGSSDPSRLSELRRSLEGLDDAEQLARLEAAVSDALRATSESPLDRDGMWARLERTLDASERDPSGPASDQSEDDSTPGR
jgi:hypothetical protein